MDIFWNCTLYLYVNVTIQMKTTEQYFPGAVYYIQCTLHKVVVTFETVDQMVRCDRLKKASCGQTMCFLISCGKIASLCFTRCF